MSQIINICKALLLNTDYEIIQDVFDIVSTKNNHFLYVNQSHVLRVTFEKDLNKFNDISVFGYGEKSNISIFYQNTSEIVTQITSITEYKQYQVILSDLNGSLNTFDLKFSGDLYIDFIIDPVLSDGLIGYWPLNETSGNFAHDYSHYDRMCSLNGNVKTNQSGIFDRSYWFGGETVSGIDAGNIDNTILSRNSVTMHAWINPDRIGMTNGVEAIMTNTNNGYALLELRLSGDGILCGMLTDDPNSHWQAGFCSGRITTNVWQMITCTWNGTHQFAYYNGELCSYIHPKAGVLYRQNSVEQPLYLGSRSINTEYFYSYKGRINEAAIWNRSLLPYEVRSLYNYGKGRRIFEKEFTISFMEKNLFHSFLICSIWTILPVCL